MGRLNNLLRWVNVIVIFATLFAYVSPYVNPSRFWQFSFFGLIYPWLLLFNVLFMFFWVLRRKKYFLFSLGCILMGWGQVKSFVGFNFFGKTELENSIKIGSYNISAFSSVWKIKSPEKGKLKEKELIDFFKKENFQILCTQETIGKNLNFLQTNGDFPHSYKIKYKSSAILSKFPIINSGTIDFGKGSNNCVWADIKIKNKTIRLYSAHLQSNRISTIADKVRSDGDISSRETLSDIKGMMGRYRFFTKKRAEQSQLIATHIQKCPYPVILCGDLNDPPQSFTYRTLTKNLKDTFKEKGVGFGTTYAGSIPALRIDYILLNEKIDVHNFRIVKENFSDHYPVICEISL